MPALRLLIIAIALWIVFRLLRYAVSKKSTRMNGDFREKMVICSICGVYLPENDATSSSDGKFRCDQH